MTSLDFSPKVTSNYDVFGMHFIPPKATSVVRLFFNQVFSIPILSKAANDKTSIELPSYIMHLDIRDHQSFN